VFLVTGAKLTNLYHITAHNSYFSAKIRPPAAGFGLLRPAAIRTPWYVKISKNYFLPGFPGVVFAFSLRSVFVLFYFRVFRKKAEGRRVVRIRIRSRIARNHAERARRRTIESVTASRADTKAF